MAALLIGYAHCSTDQQDLNAQRDALIGLGVLAHCIYVDHGLTGTHRECPGSAGRTRGVPGRRHPGSAQAGPADPVPAKCPGHRRRTDRPASFRGT